MKKIYIALGLSFAIFLFWVVFIGDKFSLGVNKLCVRSAYSLHSCNQCIGNFNENTYECTGILIKGFGGI